MANVGANALNMNPTGLRTRLMPFFATLSRLSIGARRATPLKSRFCKKSRVRHNQRDELTISID